MVDLRAYTFIDSLQPQFASFLATVAQGFLPRVGQASLFVEVAPGIEINRVTDIALKSTRVTPGMQIVERLFGMLEVHADSQADVRQAGRAILEGLEITARTAGNRVLWGTTSSDKVRLEQEENYVTINISGNFHQFNL